MDGKAAEVILGAPKCEHANRNGVATTPAATCWKHELVLQNVWVLGAYWLLAVLVKDYFSRYQMWPAPLWVPAGLAMFAALSMGREVWPGIFLGSFLTNAVTFLEPVIWAALISSGNALGPIAAAEPVRNRMGVDEMFGSVANVSYFSFSAILHGTITASIAITAM